MDKDKQIKLLRKRHSFRNVSFTFFAAEVSRPQIQCFFSLTLKKKNHFWLRGVFVAALEVSPVAVLRLLLVVASLVDHRL